MPRGVTLGQLIENLRNECKYSANPAQGVAQREMLKSRIQRTQRMLWLKYDWPYMRVVGSGDKALSAGQRFCDIPTGMDLEGIRKVWVRNGNVWTPVERGITDDLYNEADSDADMRVDPVQRWDVVDAGSGAQIEAWPIPATATTLRIRGLRALKPFVADSDVCDIDGDIIVMSCAGELLDKEAAKKAIAIAQGLMDDSKVALAPDTKLSFAGSEPRHREREIRVVYAR